MSNAKPIDEMMQISHFTKVNGGFPEADRRGHQVTGEGLLELKRAGVKPGGVAALGPDH